MTIVKQQGMEVLGVDLSPFVSIKDQIFGAFPNHVERMPLS
jgi:hypothetical protein